MPIKKQPSKLRPFRVVREFKYERLPTMDERLRAVRSENPGKIIWPLSWGDCITDFVEIEFYDEPEGAKL